MGAVLGLLVVLLHLPVPCRPLRRRLPPVPLDGRFGSFMGLQDPRYNLDGRVGCSLGGEKEGEWKDVQTSSIVLVLVPG